MTNVKDEFGIDCFRIKVGTITEFDKQWGIETIDYIARGYGESHYMLRNKGVFGCIINKEQCSLLK